MPTENLQLVLNDITTRLANIETKVRLAEQNSFNTQERMQLLSKNFLDLKKEILNRVDNLSQEAHDIEKSSNELRKKITSLESKVSAASLSSGFARAAIQPAKAAEDMSLDEAKKTLDDILVRLEK